MVIQSAKHIFSVLHHDRRFSRPTRAPPTHYHMHSVTPASLAAPPSLSQKSFREKQQLVPLPETQIFLVFPISFLLSLEAKKRRRKEERKSLKISSELPAVVIMAFVKFQD